MAIYVAANNTTPADLHVKRPTFCPTATKSGVPREILMSLQYQILRKFVQREPSRYMRTDRQTDRHRDRQTDRQTYRQTDRQTDRHRDRRT